MSVDLTLSRAALGTGYRRGDVLASHRRAIPASAPATTRARDCRPLARGWGRPPGSRRLCGEESSWAGLLVLFGPLTALAASSAAFAIWHWPSLRGWCTVHLVTGAAFGGAFLAGGLAAAMLGHALYNVLVDWAVHAEHARVRGP